MEKLVAEADLTRTLGTLRYLDGLKAARHKSSAAAVPEAASAAGPSGTDHMSLALLSVQLHLHDGTPQA